MRDVIDKNAKPRKHIQEPHKQMHKLIARMQEHHMQI